MKVSVDIGDLISLREELNDYRMIMKTGTRNAETKKIQELTQELDRVTKENESIKDHNSNEYLKGHENGYNECLKELRNYIQEMIDA